MNNAHEAKVRAAKEAVDEVFRDTSVSQKETKTSLEDIREYTEERISSLE